jgi:hypothetical protein
MVGRARRNFRRDTLKLADILRLLPPGKIAQLSDFIDYYVNREREFDLTGFIIGVRHDIFDLEFIRILEIYEAKATKLKLLALLNDALRIAGRECVSTQKNNPPNDKFRAETFPNTNHPIAKRIFSDMLP